MHKIGLKNIEIKAPIGVYKWEKESGRKFLIDVELYLENGFEGVQDDLSKTINYEKVYQIVEQIMIKERNLIETICFETAKAIYESFESLQGVKVKIHKIKPFPKMKINSAFAEAFYGNK